MSDNGKTLPKLSEEQLRKQIETEFKNLAAEALKRYCSPGRDSEVGTYAFRYFMNDLSTGENSFARAKEILSDDAHILADLEEAKAAIAERDASTSKAYADNLDDITRNISIITQTSDRLEEGLDVVRGSTNSLTAVSAEIKGQMLILDDKASQIAASLAAMQNATIQMQAATEAAALQVASTNQAAARLETSVVDVQNNVVAMRDAGSEMAKKFETVIANTSTETAIAVGTKVGYKTGLITGSITGTVTGLITGFVTGVLVTVATPWINTHLIGMPPNNNNNSQSTTTPACVSSDPPTGYRIDIGGDMPTFSFVAPAQNIRVVLGKSPVARSHRPQRHRETSACYATLKR